MSSISEKPKPDDINGALKRINDLGNSAETIFSRFYSVLDRRLRAGGPANLRQLVEQQRIEITRLYAIFSIISEGVIMQDNEGRMVHMNKAAHNLLGSQKNFWESHLGTLFDAHRDVQQLESELMPLGDAGRFVVNNRVLGVQMAAIADPQGQRLGTIMILQDVTSDELSERLKDSFVTQISHELKTPMAVIKLAGEVLTGQALDEPVNRRMLEVLGKNVDILNRMVIELLDISEMNSGSFQIAREVTLVEEVLWEVLESVEQEAKEAGVDLICMVRDVDELVIEGDHKRLNWALGHLLRNSIYYNEPGQHVILAASIEANDAGRFVAVQVIDNGVGISEEDLPHILKPFYRGKAYDRQGKRMDPRGLGQGLYVARTIAEAHGGFLSISSVQGEGSQVKMTLPASTAALPSGKAS